MTTLEGEVEATEAKINPSKMMKIGIGAIVGVIVGADAVFFVTKK